MRRNIGADKLTHIWVIMIINLLVFIAIRVVPIISDIDLIELAYLLGITKVTFLQQPWTIITSMFTHARIWHLLVNMLMLYFYGRFLIQLIGNGKFLIIYFCGGILGNIFYLLIQPNTPPAIGASGAIFALGGALAVLIPRLRVYMFPIPVAMPLWIAVIGGFIILSIVPGIAWQGHLGGLIFGLIAGYFFRRKLRLRF